METKGDRVQSFLHECVYRPNTFCANDVGSNIINALAILSINEHLDVTIEIRSGTTDFPCLFWNLMRILETIRFGDFLFMFPKSNSISDR